MLTTWIAASPAPYIATPVVRCFSRSRKGSSGSRKTQDAQETPAGHREPFRQKTVERQETRRMPTDQAREHRHSRKNSRVFDQPEAGTPGEFQVFTDRTIPWVFGGIGRPD